MCRWFISGLNDYNTISDAAHIAKKLYESSKNNILKEMMKSSHAKRLSSYDNILDIEFCSKLNTQPIIPILKENFLTLL